MLHAPGEFLKYPVERERGKEGGDTNGFNVYGGHKVCSASYVSRMRRLYFSRHDSIVHLPLRSLYDRIFLRLSNIIVKIVYV